MAGGRWEGQALELLEKVAGPGVPEKHREILQERLGPIEVVVDGAMRLSGERYALREGQEWILAGRTRGQAIHHLHYGGGECFGVREGVTGEGAKATFARLDEWNQRMEQAEENFTWEYSVEGEDGEALSEEDEIAKLEAEAAREEAARDDAYRWEAYEERDRILEEDHVEYVMVAYDEEMDTGQWGDTWIPVEVEDPSGIADLEEAAKRALERHPPELIEKGGVWVVAGAFGEEVEPVAEPWARKLLLVYARGQVGETMATQTVRWMGEREPRDAQDQVTWVAQESRRVMEPHWRLLAVLDSWTGELLQHGPKV